MTQVIHYPRLDTVVMVERFIKEHDGEFKKTQLWKSLPKKMMYQTFCVIIDYFIDTNKLAIDSEGTIGWIYYPESVKKWHARKDLGRIKDGNSFRNTIQERKVKEKSLSAEAR